jgi:hypothetical protein
MAFRLAVLIGTLTLTTVLSSSIPAYAQVASGSSTPVVQHPLRESALRLLAEPSIGRTKRTTRQAPQPATRTRRVLKWTGLGLLATGGGLYVWGSTKGEASTLRESGAMVAGSGVVLLSLLR